MFAHLTTPQPQRRGLAATSPLSPCSANVAAAKSSTFIVPFSKMFSVPLSPPMTPPNYYKSSLHETETARTLGQRASTTQQTPATRDSTERPFRDLRKPRLRRAGPLVGDAATRDTTRRSNYLGRVQEDREERVWEFRTDQILHLDFLRRQRQWEAEQARSAPNVPTDNLEFLDDYQIQDMGTMQLVSLPHSSLLDVSQLSHHMDLSISQPFPQRPDTGGPFRQDEAEIEIRLAEEQKELDALVAMHDAPPSVEEWEDEVDAWNWMASTGPASSSYGSESFEELLLGTLEVHGVFGGGGDDAMDMSG